MKIAFLGDMLRHNLDSVDFNNQIGGSEYESYALLYYLNEKGIKANLAGPKLNKDNDHDLYLIFNFWMLSEDSKQYLIDNKKYIIFEHDYKCFSNRTLESYNEGKSSIINLDFYKKALAVFTVSTIQSENFKRITNANIINQKCSYWTPQQLSILSTLGDNNERYSDETYVIPSGKGFNQAHYYVSNINRGIYIPPRTSMPDFWSNISYYTRIVLFPNIEESYGRVAIESLLLGLKVLSNNKIPSLKEQYTKDFINGKIERKELIDTIISIMKENVNRVIEVING